MGEWASGRVGRVGEWASGQVGEGRGSSRRVGDGRVGEWASG